MKTGIHPKTHKINVTCSCGTKFSILSACKDEKLSIEICDKCHPFFTGEQKIIDTQGRVEKFKQKYNVPKALNKAKNN